MSQAQEVSISGIQCVEVINGQELPTVVLMHGYGANRHDLAPLASVTPELKKFNWIFPNGKLQVPIGPHMYGSAWFPIDMARFETGIIGNLYCDHTPDGMNQACDEMQQFLTQVYESHKTLIIGGFSQGSMMSLELALRQVVPLKGVLLLSSTLVNEEKLRERKSALNFPIFQSHGTNDMVLPINFAHKLRDQLASTDQNKDQNKRHYIEFPGGHEIPPQVLFAMTTFLKEAVS